MIRVLGYYLFQMTPLIGNMSVEDQMALLLLTVKHEVSMRYPKTVTYRKSFLRKLLNKVHVMTGKIIQMFFFSLVISQNVSSFCSLFSVRKLWEGNMWWNLYRVHSLNDTSRYRYDVFQDICDGKPFITCLTFSATVRCILHFTLRLIWPYFSARLYFDAERKSTTSIRWDYGTMYMASKQSFYVW